MTSLESKGMLPLAKSSFGGLTSQFVGWSLPGHGEAYFDCGNLLVFGCDDVEAHNQARVDGVDVVGKVYVKLAKRSCLRAECPVCYEKWAGKEAHKIDYRMGQWRGGGKSIHVVLSVPLKFWSLDIDALRPRVYRVAKDVGFFGGSGIYHPFREKCVFCGSPKDVQMEKCSNCGCLSFRWEFSPHFHLIGYGWIHGEKVKKLYERDGWITKNLGVRDSVEATAFYQLSHCGIHKDRHAVTWFGAMAYNKLRVVPEVVERERCPLCGGELFKLRWVGEGEMPFNDEGEYFDVPDNWIRGFIWKGGG